MTTRILLKLNNLVSLCMHKKSGITFIKDGFTGVDFMIEDILESAGLKS